MVVMVLSWALAPRGTIAKAGAWVLSLLKSVDLNLLVQNIPVVTDTQDDFHSVRSDLC